MNHSERALGALLALGLAAQGAGASPAREAPAATPAATPQATTAPGAAVELVVFAAASMTEAMNEIARLYTAGKPGVTIVYNFDSSGTLKTQIEAGAACDLFISAGQLQMDQLDAAVDPAVNKTGLDFVAPGTRFDIVANEVVLITPQGSDKGIAAFEDVMTGKVALVALGNADVPAGQYAREVYTNLGLWDQLVASGKVSYGSNVKEVLAQVESAAVDCGVVYGTDAASSKGVVVAAGAPAGSHRPITYPAAVMKGAANRAAIDDFVAYLKGDEAQAVFARIGFSKP